MLGAVNSINLKGNTLAAQPAFKGNFELDTSSVDFSELDRIVKKYKDVEDEFVKNPETKSKAGVLASVALGACVLFGLGKKGYNKTTEITKSILNTKIGKQAADSASKLVNKGLAEAVVKSDKAAKLVSRIAKADTTNVQNALNKVGGMQNVAGALTSVGGIACVATTDANNDGVADIAQKGVNAYRNTVQRIGIIGEAIDALT